MTVGKNYDVYELRKEHTVGSRHFLEALLLDHQ